MDEVWRAGRKQANIEEQTNSSVIPKSIKGLPEVPSVHLASSFVLGQTQQNARRETTAYAGGRR
jgi:hypothetical protein